MNRFPGRTMSRRAFVSTVAGTTAAATALGATAYPLGEFQNPRVDGTPVSANLRGQRTSDTAKSANLRGQRKFDTAESANLRGQRTVDTTDVTWHNVQDWGVEGRAWDDTIRYFDRLPAAAESVVREAVWDLSRHSAGMAVRFATDAAAIHVRYALLSDRLAMPHMPATGVSGLDLYGEDSQGIDRWVNVVRPTEQTMEVALADGLAPGLRNYTIYLPLYNGVESLEIGVESDATFEPLAPRSAKPIVFYGTSIMHGACASRPGMSIPAILGRRLKMPVVNLGFSGNGRMEPEVADLLVELDPAAFVVDCVPNMNAEMIAERAMPLVRRLKTARPETPVLLVEDRAFSNTPFFPARGLVHRNNRVALRAAFEGLREEGLDGLFYLAGRDLMGLDGEGATDGSHPSDLGMMRYADAYEPALRALLSRY